jgi:hypothetical protein
VLEVGVFVSVVGCLLAWAARGLELARRERELASGWRVAGCRLALGYKGPLWLRRIVPVKRLTWLYGVTEIQVRRGATGEDIRVIRRLFYEVPGVQVLDLGETEVKDAEIQWIQHERIEALRLHGTGVGDDSMRWIAHVRGLRELTIGRTRVTDAGVVSLQSASSLEKLMVNDTMVTDECLNALSSLRRLRVLSLSRTGVSRSGLLTWHGVPRLQYLYVADVGLSQADATVLEGRIGGDVSY